MSRAILYLRVSTEDQSTGLSVQRAACISWAGAHGLPVAAEYADQGVSGGLDPSRRPGLLGALGALRKGDTLVVHKRDRLARDVMAAGMAERLAEKAGARIVCADGTGNGSGPTDALMRTIVDAFAAYELALIRMRTASALQQKKASGLRYGKDPPYGWRHEGELGFMRMVEDPQEQAARDKAGRLRASGLSFKAIGEALVEAGHRPRGKAWYPSTIKRMLEYQPPTAAAASGCSRP